MKKPCIVFVISCLFYSCGGVYIPNSVNSPMLGGKGEGQINSSLQVNLPRGTSFNAQGAYAVGNNVGLLLNTYGFTSKLQTWQGTRRSGRGGLIEGGMGYFKRNSDGIVFETYAGAGIGTINIRDLENPNSGNIQLADPYYFQSLQTRFFVQPSIGYVHTHVEVSFTGRFSNVSYSLPNTNYPKNVLEKDHFINFNLNNRVFFEPSMLVRAGGEKLKYQVQFGRTFAVSTEVFSYAEFYVSTGFVYQFKPKKKPQIHEP
ncbi:MAG: hypothetical protein ACK4GN_05235 [Runella sp.]